MGSQAAGHDPDVRSIIPFRFLPCAFQARLYTAACFGGSLRGCLAPKIGDIGVFSVLCDEERGLLLSSRCATYAFTGACLYGLFSPLEYLLNTATSDEWQ